MVEPKLTREQIEDAPPSDALVVEPQDVPDDTVVVAPGVLVMADNETVLPYEGTLASPAFGALTVANYRWDLVCIDLTTATPELAGPWSNPSLKGIESATPVEWYDGIPVVPQGYMPVAAIRVTETTGNPVLIVASDIVDVRGFFHAIQAGAQFLGYAPVTYLDWISVPTTIKAGLDQLANRLNRSVMGNPLTVSLSPNDAGTSKVAARSDHRHYHGLLGNTGSIDWQHKAAELGHAYVAASNWDGSSEADCSARLEELAARNRILQDAFFSPYIDTVTGDRQGSSSTWMFTNTRQGSLVGSGNEFWYTLPSEHYILESLHIYVFDYITSYNAKHRISFIREGAFLGGLGGNYNGRLVSFKLDSGVVSTDNDTAIDIVIPSAYNPFSFLNIPSVGATWDVKMKKDGDTFYVWFDDSSSVWDTGATHCAILEARAVFSVYYDNYSP